MREELHTLPVDRQKAIMAFLESREKFSRMPPTVREIGEAVGLRSSSTIHGHLRRMHRQGLINWEPKLSRSIRLNSAPTDSPLWQAIKDLVVHCSDSYSKDPEYWTAIRRQDLEKILEVMGWK